MSNFNDYKQRKKLSKKLYEIIDYVSFPKVQYNELDKTIPYTEGSFISSPLLHYLIENKFYESHASGIEDFGMTLKPFFGIDKDRFIMIETIDEITFKITYVVEPVDEVLTELLYKVDYDMRVFDKLGFAKKSKIVKFGFTISEDKDEDLDQAIVNLGVIPYNDINLD